MLIAAVGVVLIPSFCALCAPTGAFCAPAVNVREAWLRDGTGEMLEQLTEDEDRARFFGGLSKESASPEVLAFIDALRKTPEPAIRAALEFVCNVYESYNALQKEKENGD